MTDLERKTLLAWEHIRQCGSTFITRNDGLRSGYRELKRKGRVTIDGNMVRLAGPYLRAFHAGEDLGDL